MRPIVYCNLLVLVLISAVRPKYYVYTKREYFGQPANIENPLTFGVNVRLDKLYTDYSLGSPHETDMLKKQITMFINK